jgi:hypothetical protein
MGSRRGEEWRRPDLGGSRLREHRLPQEGGVERDGGGDGVGQRQEQDTEEAGWEVSGGCEPWEQRRKDMLERDGKKGVVVILHFFCILTSTQICFAEFFLKRLQLHKKPLHMRS